LTTWTYDGSIVYAPELVGFLDWYARLETDILSGRRGLLSGSDLLWRRAAQLRVRRTKELGAV
jgi:hypothetical protein